MALLIWFAVNRLFAGYVAARRQAEESLRKSERNLAVTLDSIGDAVIATDTAGRITWINPVAEKLTGWTKDESVGRPIAEVFHIKNAITNIPGENPVERVLREGQVVGLANHTMLIARDGTEYQIADSGAPIRDEDGSISGVVMVFRDVTEEYRKNEMMRLMQFSIDHAPEDILWLRPDGTLFYVNDAACMSLGYTREELLSMTVHDINPDFPKEAWERYWKNITEHGSISIDAVHRKKDGTIFPVEVICNYIEFEDKEFNLAFVRDITEREKARKIVENDWSGLRQYVDHLLTFNARLDPDGILTMVNRTAIQATGLEESELIGKPFPDTYWWNYDQQVQERLKIWIIRAAKGVTIIQDVSILTRQGLIRIQFSLRPVSDEYGNVIYLIAEGQDITRIKETEEELKKSYDLINSISIFTGIADTEGRLQFVNTKTIEALGFSKEEVMGIPFWECGWISRSDPKNMETVREVILAALNGETTRKEVKGSTKEGSELSVLFSATPMLDDAGEVTGVALEGVDISDLRETEERYRILFDACPDGILVADLETRENLYGNPAFYRMLGYTHEDLKSLKLEDLHPKDKITEVARAIQAHLSGETPLAEDIPILKKNGTIINADINIARTIMEGREIGVGFTRDITERKRLEAQVRQLQKMEAIGTLAGGIAHDFNNILSPIVGYGELIRQKASEERFVSRYVERILECSNRAKDLIRQILTFSRKSDEEKKPILIQPILKEALKLLRSSIPTSIDIRQDVNPDCGVVMANPIQIHQIIMNLCTNAFHAMREGEGTGILEVRLGESEFDLHGMGPERCIKLEVRDTGHGIESQILDRIFDPYFTTKGPGEGTGMGLAITYGIVKEYGGHIEVDTEPGKGSLFTIYLPVAEVGAAKKEPVAVMDSVKGGRERILVVDDEDVIAIMLQQMLESIGYQVTIRTSSVEAFNLFQAKPDYFDLVITDMTMPNMTGLVLISKLKILRPDIPVILCTGFSEQVTEQKIDTLGINKLLMKPIFLKGLAKAVRDVLDQK
jgi:PAS domain S-box-containing protein